MMDRWLENDTVLKIVSLLVAIFVWIQVDAVPSRPAQVDRVYGPLSLAWNPPKASDLTVANLRPESVEVQLQGSLKSLSSAKIANMTAFVNLTTVTHAGNYTLPIAVALPTGTRLVKISPAQVTVAIDQMGSRRIAITTQAEGHPPAKYELISLVPTVADASLSGPTQDLDRVNRLVAYVPVAGHTESFDNQSLLSAVTASGAVVPHVEVTPPMVSVAATIRPRPPQAVIGVIARVSGRPAAGYTISSISVTPSHLTVTGPKSELSKLSTVYTSAIDVAGVTGPISGEIAVTLPRGVSSISGNLVQVTVNIGPK